MRLHGLLADSGLAAPETQVLGDADVEVGSVVMDSRRVGPGALYACVVGANRDGHDFARAAVADGAVALLVRRPQGVGVPEVLVPDVRAAIGPLCDAFFGHPSARMRVVGVTGTNGKTTTVSLLATIFSAHGWPAASIGTLSGARTTAEAPDLQAELAELERSGIVGVAMEVSSHALDQRRVDGTHFVAGVWTNLTQDHLDYHGDMDTYFEAKARLFEPGRVELAVVNADDAYGRRLLERIRPGLPTEAYCLKDAKALTLSRQGSSFTFDGAAVHLALPGRFNVANALAAATTARALGIPAATIAEGLTSVTAVRGRFERVEAGQPFTVLVDYAHTPDGLAKALEAAREITSGRLIVVFGAGGDRDPGKRPLMGEVATRLADLAVLTSDNPRSEDPMAIIEAVAAGAVGDRRPTCEPDRRAAIAMALSLAEDGDVVVVAGKGHESGQDFGGRVEPFDDVTVAREALLRILGSRAAQGSQGQGAGADAGPDRPGREGDR